MEDFVHFAPARKPDESSSGVKQMPDMFDIDRGTQKCGLSR